MLGCSTPGVAVSNPRPIPPNGGGPDGPDTGSKPQLSGFRPQLTSPGLSPSRGDVVNRSELQNQANPSFQLSGSVDLGDAEIVDRVFASDIEIDDIDVEPDFPKAIRFSFRS